MSEPTPPVEVILVDAQDQPIGTAEKLAAHRPPGQLHRAISAFVLDDDGRILLQRRADAKHAFAGAWSNSCCTHPAPGESTVAAAERRVVEELGIACRFEELGTFTYRAEDPASGLVEHEVDHVLVGWSSAAAQPDPAEVAEVRAVHVAELRADLAAAPDRYSPWLAPALAVLLDGAPSVGAAPSPDPKDAAR